MEKKLICPKCHFLVLEAVDGICPNCGHQLERKPVKETPQLKIPTIADYFPPKISESDKKLGQSVEAQIPIDKFDPKDSKTVEVAIPQIDDFTISSPDVFEPEAPIPQAQLASPSAPSVLQSPNVKVRMVAAIIDFSAIVIITFALWQIAGVISGFSGTIFEPESPLWLPALLLFVLIIFTYHGWFNGMVGSSPGKALFGLRVITRDGFAPGFFRGGLRGGLALLGMVFGGINGAVVIVEKKGRGIHDFILKTFVVETPQKKW